MTKDGKQPEVAVDLVRERARGLGACRVASHSIRTAFTLTTLVGSVVVACAGNQKSGETKAAASPAAESQPAYADQAAGAPARAYPAEPAAPSAPAPAEEADARASRAAPSPPPGSSTSGPTSRAIALSQASSEIETSQRELDVAGGDCGNACRALGSMDRAAGRLCGLAQSSDERHRCDDAKTRVYSARDKVKRTCGSCPDVSVERSAPIPSR